MFQTWKSPGYFFNDTQHLIQVTLIIIIIDMTNQKDRHESDFPANKKTTHLILRWFDSCFSCFSLPRRSPILHACKALFLAGVSFPPDGTSWLNTLSLSHRIHVCYIYGNIYHQYTPNVSIYSIHGSYGYG